MDRVKVANELVKIAKLLSAAPPKQERLDSKTIRKINEYLHSISTGSIYYEKLPLNDVFDHLKKFGVVPMQEDNTPWSGFILGKEGYTDIDCGRDLGGNKVGPPFVNTHLHMNWYKMESGRYEFIVRMT